MAGWQDMLGWQLNCGTFRDVEWFNNLFVFQHRQLRRDEITPSPSPPSDSTMYLQSESVERSIHPTYHLPTDRLAATPSGG
jgi:hypothetical protein